MAERMANVNAEKQVAASESVEILRLRWKTRSLRMTNRRRAIANSRGIFSFESYG